MLVKLPTKRYKLLALGRGPIVEALIANSSIYSNETLLVMLVALLFTGVIAGLLAGLLGVGGGIVIVPVLFILFSFVGVPPEIIMHMSVATSLLTIIPTSFSSARSHHRRGAVDFAVLKSWGPILLAGADICGCL